MLCLWTSENLLALREKKRTKRHLKSLSYCFVTCTVLVTNVCLKAKQKNMCVSGYMFLKIRVGRSEYFLYFEIILFAWSIFYKNKTGISTFFSLSRGDKEFDLGWRVVCSARALLQKHFSKVSFNVSCNKNRLETETFFLREELMVKTQKRQ